MSSVVIKSIDRNKIHRAVNKFNRRIRLEHPEISRVIWFGSWIHGHPVPGSDVDLCLILNHTDLPPRDRISKYLPVGFPVGLDLLVYTQQEFELLDEISPGLKREILKGKDLK
ncbi:MAG: DNA polymerase III subunit beta [Chloroflexi bacterium RBG_16_54_18]|nr:MAG: DNA polymerase III subunit beta [Chloroflexi bacterium RBG_16_54_18]